MKEETYSYQKKYNSPTYFILAFHKCTLNTESMSQPPRLFPSCKILHKASQYRNMNLKILIFALQILELIDLLNWDISLSTASPSYKLNYYSRCKHKNPRDEPLRSSFDETPKKCSEFEGRNNPALLIRAN